MPSTPTSPGLFTSSALRLALLYSGLLAIAFALTAVMVRRIAFDAAESDLRQMIELEISSIAHELDAEGLDAAIGAIAARAERPGAPKYWLTDTNGARLIGDVPDMEGPNGWREVAMATDHPYAEDRNKLLVLTHSFPSGVRLSVGEDVGSRRRAIDDTLTILLQIGAASVVAAMLLGYFLTRASLKRLRIMTETLERVGAGDLAARTPAASGFFASDAERVAAGVNRMLDRNQALVEGLRRVTRDIAHDLRTPLFHLRQRLDCARVAKGDAKDREIDAADDKATDIVRTFDAILRLAEIEAGMAKSRFGSVDLSGLIETLADAYGPDIEKQGGALRIEMAGTPYIRGDRELLMQGLANLIENTARYAGAAPKVLLKVEACPVLAVRVIDNGAGVPEPMLAEIAEPFARVDASRSREGCGLGLSIAKAIAELHDATLELKNIEGGFSASIIFSGADPVGLAGRR